MRQCGVVDRQRLNHLHTRQGSPVCHLLQIQELADTEAFVCPEREDRYRYTGTFPARLGATERTIVMNHLHAFLQTPDMTVLTPFHVHHIARLQVVDAVFVFDNGVCGAAEVTLPDGELGITQHFLLSGVPVS